MTRIFSGNRTRLLTIAVLIVLFVTAIQGMPSDEWMITVLRGLSLGMVTFLVAAGLSLIFGLMDVLNLAHGELFMVGAYAGWTVFVRPDTFVDVLPPILLIAVGFVLLPAWHRQLNRLNLSARARRIFAWACLIAGVAVLLFVLARYPVSASNPRVFMESPQSYATALDQGRLTLPDPPAWQAIAPMIALAGLVIGGGLLAVSLAAFRMRSATAPISRRAIIQAAGLLTAGLIVFFANDALTGALLGLNTTWRFFLAISVATLLGFVLGALIEMTLIRPLYARPIYQLMITLGLSFILIEVVRTVWGRPEFTMPKAALFSGTGDGCPARSIGDLIANQCSTIFILGSRVRTYNEVFIIVVGLLVLAGVWLLLQRTRIGMIIRAGVQDSEMVEALGINVRQVFTFVFALGVGLAAFGGVLAAPHLGLSTGMGTRLLLLALIALAIGGLTSFPGAAVGAVLVGLLQQFIIKYGQIGINLPFLDEPFKPSPPLVPASTVLLMVIILLILPNGLFGRSE